MSIHPFLNDVVVMSLDHNNQVLKFDEYGAVISDEMGTSCLCRAIGTYDNLKELCRLHGYTLVLATHSTCVTIVRGKSFLATASFDSRIINMTKCCEHINHEVRTMVNEHIPNPTTHMDCPICGKLIHVDAIKCKHCWIILK